MASHTLEPYKPIVAHIAVEVAGTAGAIASSAAISRFGNNYSFLLTPGQRSVTRFRIYLMPNLAVLFFVAGVRAHSSQWSAHIISTFCYREYGYLSALPATIATP